MENEQIVPNGNIVTNSINEFNGVDDADDFFYKEGEENTNNDLTTAVEVDPKIFENVTPSEPLADNNVSTSESLSGIEPIIEPINFDNLNK